MEAVLFLAGEPLSSRKISQLASLADGTEARTLIRRLNAWYDREESAFRIEEVAGGFQLVTRPRYALWLRRLAPGGGSLRLSPPALETLAVVAYRQPVLRAEIESIRGVQCGEVLRQLMERDLVKIVGKSPELGRPFLYGTTRRFLQVFGLRGLQDLPGLDRFAGSGGPVEAPLPHHLPPQTLSPKLPNEYNSPHPAGRPLADGPLSAVQDHGINPIVPTEESHVTTISTEEQVLEERLDSAPLLVALTPRADDDDDFDDEEDEDFEDEYDLDEEEEDEEDEEEEDEEDYEDEDYEEDEWEEVDDDEDEWEDEDEDGFDDEEDEEDWEDEDDD